MSQEQKSMLRGLMSSYSPFILHHGDCFGADCEAHGIALEIGGCVGIEIHPPENEYKRAWCSLVENQNKVIGSHNPKPYLKRNHDIVEATTVLIAAPKEKKEVLRSGTWATVRYARKAHRKIQLLYPDGTLHNEEWTLIGYDRFYSKFLSTLVEKVMVRRDWEEKG